MRNGNSDRSTTPGTAGLPGGRSCREELQGIWDAALATQPLGAITFTVSRDQGRPEREALATLHVAQVQIRPPARLAPRHLAPVLLHAILLQNTMHRPIKS